MVGRVKCGFGPEPKRMNHPPKPARRRFRLVSHSAVLLAGALTAGALPSCSATSDERTAGSTSAIAGGVADASHQNVFLLVRESQDSGALCTATLIAPNLLLTARHCVSPGTGDDHVLCGDSVLGDPYPASAFIATNDAQPRRSSPIFHARDVRVPGLGEDTCGYDVALIILNENVPADISEPAVPRIDREVQPGESYTAVGYGLDESGDSTGSRMQLAGLSIECEPGSCGEGVESTEFRGERGICSGDSGGPALDADGKVVGVVSRGGPECSTPVYSTVTAWHDFIIETATAAAVLGGYEAPFWVTTGLSDPPVLIGNDGGAGAAGAPGAAGASSAPGASEGEECDSGHGCDSGLICYAANGETTGRCSAVCQDTSDCNDGLVCQNAGSVSVCTVPTGSADDKGGCSVAPARAPGSSGGLLLAALGALAFSTRRRRARSC
jgi:MYXO-CTERM domain-containing protein